MFKEKNIFLAQILTELCFEGLMVRYYVSLNFSLLFVILIYSNRVPVERGTTNYYGSHPPPLCEVCSTHYH